MGKIPDEIKNFFDQDGLLKIWPGKRRKQLLVLEFLAELFSPGREFSEKEINQIIEENHTFGDAALLRRELFDGGYLNREKDGSIYWREREEKDG